MALLQSVWVGHPTSVMPFVNYLIIKNTYIYPLIRSHSLSFVCIRSFVCYSILSIHLCFGDFSFLYSVHCVPKQGRKLNSIFNCMPRSRSHIFICHGKISFQCNKHELNNWSAILPLSRRRCFILPIEETKGTLNTVHMQTCKHSTGWFFPEHFSCKPDEIKWIFRTNK